MRPQKVRIYTENLAEEHFLGAIFRDRIDKDEALVASFLLSDAALSVALKSLAEHPERPIALVFNANTADPEEIDETRSSLVRILSGVATNGWHVALAAPKLNAWVKADPRIRQAFESDDSTRENYDEQAIRIDSLVRSQPFDVEALRKASPEFKRLEGFIDRMSGSPIPPVKTTRSRS